MTLKYNFLNELFIYQLNGDSPAIEPVRVLLTDDEALYSPRASTYSGKIETEIMIQISSNFEVGNTSAGLVCQVPARPQYPLDQ